MSAMSELDLIRREEFEVFFLGVQSGDEFCEFCGGDGYAEDEYEGELVRFNCPDCHGEGVSQ